MDSTSDRKVKKKQHTPKEGLKSHEIEMSSQKPTTGFPVDKPERDSSGDAIESDASSLDSDEDTTNRENSTVKHQEVGNTIKKPKRSLPAEIPISVNSKFKPPTAFTQQEIRKDSLTSDLLSESNLEGKQIWYITAPSSFDISSLKSISPTAISNGASIIKSCGDKYGFSATASDVPNLKLFAPNAEEGRYGVVSKSVCTSLRIYQTLDGINMPVKDSETMKSVVKKKKNKLKRSQPRGLKMRYHPFGCGPAKPERIGDDSCSEVSAGEEVMKDNITTFKPPPSFARSKKRKSRESLGDNRSAPKRD